MFEQPQPAPKRTGRGKFFAIGCGALAALVILIIVIALAASSGGSGSSTSATATLPPTQAATQAPTTTLKWTTVQTINGNGSKKTAIFTVPDDWKILWSCTGGDFGGYLGVTVYDSNAAYVDGAVNATCKTGTQATTGETEEHQGGQVYLDVNGVGDWSLQVQELK